MANRTRVYGIPLYLSRVGSLKFTLSPCVGPTVTTPRVRNRSSQNNPPYIYFNGIIYLTDEISFTLSSRITHYI